MVSTSTRGARRRDRERGRRVAGAVALTGTVIASIAVAFAAGAGSPLFILYQSEWGFPNWQLTAAFAVYAVALLATLLVAGSLSDHLGRRRVLTAALLLMTAASVFYLVADNIVWILVARTVQGAATGAATSTFTASIIEQSPPRIRSAMTVVTSAAPVGGLALGAATAGIAVQTSTEPTFILFTALIAIFTVGIMSVLLSKETVERSSGALASLRPRLAVPSLARPWFGTLAPLIASGWMFSGLFMGLGPSLNRHLFEIDSEALNGAVVAIQPMFAALTGLMFTRMPPRTAIRIGAVLVTAGAALAIAGIVSTNLWLTAAGAAVGGAGQGAAFGSSLRILAPLADSKSRGGLFAAVYLIAYMSYGVPVLIAGIASGGIGYAATAEIYAAIVAMLGGTALAQRSPLDASTPSLSATAVQHEGGIHA
jgi:hypothetical protein